MREGLTRGQIGRLARRVTPEETIHLGAEDPGGGLIVFATPSLINLLEHAAREALRPYLEPGEESVGVTVEIEHLAATPPGAEVQAEATVVAIDGRMIDFTLSARDAGGEIGRGKHRRAIVRLDKMRARLAEKAMATDRPMLPATVEPNPGALPELATVLLHREGPLAILTLNRPARLNAVDTAMTADLEKVVGWFAGHEEIRVVILTGAGRSFCAGDDVKELSALSVDEARRLSLRQARLYLAFEQLPQVLIAAVNGPALGAGSVCACACDFRLASTGAKFGMPEILLGWAPGYGVAQLTALVGKARALELCLTGQPVGAQRAVEIGLAHQVVPPPLLLPTAQKLADSLLATPPIALRRTKRLLHEDEGARPKLTHLADTAAYIDCLQTDDAREGIRAFAEKRKAGFEGR